MDEDGYGIVSYRYSDFGETEKFEIVSFENKVCYTGGIYDESTGLYYLNARYYDPASARFLTQDTYRGEDADATTWNLYAYCANNPVNYIDPSGHVAVAATVVYVSSVTLYQGAMILATVTYAAYLSLKYGIYNGRRYTSSVKHYGYKSSGSSYNTIPTSAAAHSGSTSSTNTSTTPTSAAASGVKTVPKTGKASAKTKASSKSKAGENKKNKGKTEKGKSFRGGNKKSRDKWYGKNDKQFQKWWERQGKKSYGHDISNSNMADEVYREWIDLGKPRGR